MWRFSVLAERDCWRIHSGRFVYAEQAFGYKPEQQPFSQATCPIKVMACILAT